MRISVGVEEVTLQGDYGEVAGVSAKCSKCGHETESFGTEEKSYKRCLALMREECPQDENNFYVI